MYTRLLSLPFAALAVGCGVTEGPATSELIGNLGGAPAYVKTEIPLVHASNFGSLSGLVYDPSDDTYWAHDDNRTGTVTHPTIFQFKVVGNSYQILQALPLRDESGNIVPGSTSSTAQNGNLVPGGLDPEGIDLAPDGTFWLCDEEYETVFQINKQGQILQRVYPPGLSDATRVRGAGLEGVAVSADGSTVYTINQTPLLGAPSTDVNTFIAAYTIATGTWRFYTYPLDAVSSYTYPTGTTGVRMGAHDLKFGGIDDQGRETLVVVERDNKRNAEARDKRLYRIALPTTGGTSIATAVAGTKTLAVDLVAHGYVLEKPEGLVLRGDTFVVINDNVQTATDSQELSFFKPIHVSTPDSVLWTPNHTLRHIQLDVDTGEGPAPTVTFDVTSSDGDEAHDVAWIGGELYLRSERRHGDRVYTITATATDAFGNESSDTTIVTVPHNHGHGNDDCASH